MRKGLFLPLVPAALPGGGLSTPAQDAGDPAKHVLSKAYPEKACSPCAQRAFPSQVLRGDTHPHTRLPADAGLFANMLGLDDACRFAKGDEITASSGQEGARTSPIWYTA